MKQTKKITYRQREFLNRKCHFDTTGSRLVAEDKLTIKVQSSDGAIHTFLKETGKEI